MKTDQNEEIISLDLTIPDTVPETVPSIHPKRGTFNLEAALQTSRQNGYGNFTPKNIFHKNNT